MPKCQMSRTDPYELKDYMSTLIQILAPTFEEHATKDVLIANNKISLYGFTDISMAEVSKKIGCLILTDDFRVSTYYQAISIPVLNMNHLRQVEWGKL